MPSSTFTTRGGARTASIYSGIIGGPGLAAAPGAANAGPDVLFIADTGRLCSIIPHAAYLSLSGIGVLFYDAPVVSSGGPLYASGHRVIGALPGGFGVSGQLVPAGVPIPVDLPFQSGLCAGTRSGAVGFTVSYNIEDYPSF